MSSFLLHPLRFNVGAKRKASPNKSPLQEKKAHQGEDVKAAPKFRSPKNIKEFLAILNDRRKEMEEGFAKNSIVIDPFEMDRKIEDLKDECRKQDSAVFAKDILELLPQMRTGRLADLYREYSVLFGMLGTCVKNKSGDTEEINCVPALSRYLSSVGYLLEGELTPTKDLLYDRSRVWNFLRKFKCMVFSRIAQSVIFKFMSALESNADFRKLMKEIQGEEEVK